MDDKAFLEYIVTSLVDNPDDVKIDRIVDEMGVLITLSVNPADMGKIIGRQGNTAQAIRTLLRVIGMKNNARVNLKINEPEGGRLSATGSEDFTNEDASENARENIVADKKSSTAPAQSAASKSIDDAMEDLKDL